MPRKFLFTKEEIVDAAVDLAREKGYDAITARALGAKLGSSPRPIFSYFSSMSDVQAAVEKAAIARYREYLRAERERGEYPPYKASGMAYIRFAREEKELFKLLFMRPQKDENSAALNSDFDDMTDLVAGQADISTDKAKLFHLEIWAYVHGVATMIATNYFDWSEELCSAALTDAYQGLKFKYENDGEKIPPREDLCKI